MAHPECGQHHSLGLYPGLNSGKSWLVAFIVLWFLTGCRSSLSQWTNALSHYQPKLTLSPLRCFCQSILIIATEKATKTFPIPCPSGTVLRTYAAIQGSHVGLEANQISSSSTTGPGPRWLHLPPPSTQHLRTVTTNKQFKFILIKEPQQPFSWCSRICKAELLSHRERRAATSHSLPVRWKL